MGGRQISIISVKAWQGKGQASSLPSCIYVFQQARWWQTDAFLPSTSKSRSFTTVMITIRGSERTEWNSRVPTEHVELHCCIVDDISSQKWYSKNSPPLLYYTAAATLLSSNRRSSTTVFCFNNTCKTCMLLLVCWSKSCVSHLIASSGCSVVHFHLERR